MLQGLFFTRLGPGKYAASLLSMLLQIFLLKKNILKKSVVLEVYPNEEIIDCCSCLKDISKTCSNFEEDKLSNKYFNKLKKVLIQYFQ